MPLAGYIVCGLICLIALIAVWRMTFYSRRRADGFDIIMGLTTCLIFAVGTIWFVFNATVVIFG